MSVGEFCSREVVVVEKSASIIETARLMRAHHVGDVIVVQIEAGERKPIGIVTDRDLVVQLLALNRPIESSSVADVMSVDLVIAGESDGIWETLQRMRARGVRRVPVVNGAGALTGILTADDLLELLGEELSDLVKLISHQQVRERQRRR
jgi:CBS domain-containing protein